MVKGFFNPPFPALKAGHPNICLSHASWLMSLSHPTLPYPVYHFHTICSFVMTLRLYFYVSFFYLTFATHVHYLLLYCNAEDHIFCHLYQYCSLFFFIFYIAILDLLLISYFFHGLHHCHITATCYVSGCVVDSPSTCTVMYVIFLSCRSSTFESSVVSLLSMSGSITHVCQITFSCTCVHFLNHCGCKACTCS